MRFVVGSEVAAGRVVEEHGLYSIAPGSFARETLLALQTLAPIDAEAGRRTQSAA